MWTYNYTEDLYHHGIKGQKWGRRRFQNKDGSLTPAGEKRYDDSGEKKKSKHRLHLEAKYKSQGMSDADAQAAAAKRIKTEKIVGVAAGLTVAACAAYVGTKIAKERVDRVIKTGAQMQRIEMQDTGGKLHDVFYTSKGKHDNERYAGLLGMTRQRQTGQAFMMKLESQKDIKVASKHNAAKVFEDLYKNDSEFRSSVKGHVGRHFTGVNALDPNDTSPKNMRKLYENFNANLIDIRRSGTGTDQKFYKALQNKGYGAIQDINDMKFSGYRAKNPLIVFGNSDNIMVKSVKKMDGNLMVDGMKQLSKARAEEKVEAMLKEWGPMAVTTAAGLTVTSAAMVTEGYRKSENEKRR